MSIFERKMQLLFQDPLNYNCATRYPSHSKQQTIHINPYPANVEYRVSS